MTIVQERNMPLAREPQPLQWSLPKGYEIEPDDLKVRLDFYQSAVVMFVVDKGVIHQHRVSARDVAVALLSETPMSSGLLAPNTLWWEPNRVGLWEPPQVWSVALQLEPLKPPKRFRLPMPGLIFVCRSARPPHLFAAKNRPRKLSDAIYHAPLFNIFDSGLTCEGSHKYSLDVQEIPRDFMCSLFTEAAAPNGRSKKYPHELLPLWQEINGQKKYPMHDLVQCGTMADLVRPPTATPQPEPEEEGNDEDPDEVAPDENDENAQEDARLL